jgi:hypothetical protein
VIAIVVTLGAAPALAKPKVAVAPIDGDTNDRVARVLVELLEDEAKVIGPDEVASAVRSARSGTLSESDVKRIQNKLDVSVVVHGALKKTGGKRTLSVIVSGKDDKPSKFSVKFKSAASDSFRKGVRGALVKRVEAEVEDEPEVAEAAAEPTREVRKKPRRKRRTDDDNTEEVVAESVRSSMTQPVARIDAGLTYGMRRLTWGNTTANGPPRVVTPAPSFHVEGELYPLALADPKSSLRALGLAVEYDKAFALSIRVPGTTTDASINQAHYAVGARYRLEVGEASTVALGLDYRARHYLADRTGLMAGALDTPDFNYGAIAPNAGARVPVTPTVTAFGSAGFLLITKTGAVQRSDSYGYATVYGLELGGGADIVLTEQLALRVAADFSQMSFSFKQGAGTLAMTRGVESATDRWFSLAATVGYVY